MYLGPGRMELQDAPDPQPGRGEVVIASRTSAICGSDLHGFREASPRRIPPLVMGHETVGVIDATGEGVDPSLAGHRVVLKPIVACGVCDECRAGDINHCATGRLVGRDLPGGFAERFAVPRSPPSRSGRPVRRPRNAHGAAGERGTRGLARCPCRRPRVRDRRGSDRRPDGARGAAVRRRGGARDRPGRRPAAAGRGAGRRGPRRRRRRGRGRPRGHRRARARARDRRRRLRGHVGTRSARRAYGRADLPGGARSGVGLARLLRRARQGGHDHRLVRVDRRRLRARARAAGRRGARRDRVDHADAARGRAARVRGAHRRGPRPVQDRPGDADESEV